MQELEPCAEYFVASSTATPAKTACSQRRRRARSRCRCSGTKSRRHRPGTRLRPALRITHAAAHDGGRSTARSRQHRQRRMGGHGLPLGRQPRPSGPARPEEREASSAPSPAAGQCPATSLAATPAGRGSAKVEHVFAAQKHRFELVIRHRRRRHGRRQSWAFCPTSPTTSPGSPGSRGNLPPHDAAGREAAADRRRFDTETATRPDRRADTAQPANPTPKPGAQRHAVRRRSVTVQIGRAMTFRQGLSRSGNQPTDGYSQTDDHSMDWATPTHSVWEQQEVPQLSERQPPLQTGLPLSSSS